MPVDSAVNSQYSLSLRGWKKIRACMAGEDVVKACEEEFLPRPSGLTIDQYRNDYLRRARFFGASRRTVQGYLGAIFRKDACIELPEGTQFENLEWDIDLSGTPLEVFAQQVVHEVLAVGRCGVLTDMTSDTGEPYLVPYLAEAIKDWRRRRINGKPTLEQVVLFEEYQEPNADGFGSKTIQRYRVLELDENGLYVVRIFEVDTSGVWTEARIEPSVRGKRIDYIPFVFYGPASLDPDVQASPVRELVDVNIAHYMTQADLQHGAHWTALPTPVVIGVDDPAVLGSMTIGSQSAWGLPIGGDAKFLEFSGNGLAALRENAQEMKDEMVQLGARMLEDQKRAAETADSKRIQYSGDNSVLAGIANTVSRGLEQNLMWAVEWIGGDPSVVTVRLNTDFFDTEMSPAEVTALVNAWQSGAISHETLLYNLERGEVLPPDCTPEDEMARIEEAGPALGSIQPAANDSGGDIQGQGDMIDQSQMMDQQQSDMMSA